LDYGKKNKILHTTIVDAKKVKWIEQKKNQIGNAKICLKQVQKKARRQFVISKNTLPPLPPSKGF